MIAQYTAASLVSENKVIAHPASVDSIPTSANKEDHVSMGAIAARKCRNIVENTEQVIAIELLCGAQAIDHVHQSQGRQRYLGCLQKHPAQGGLHDQGPVFVIRYCRCGHAFAQRADCEGCGGCRGEAVLSGVLPSFHQAGFCKDLGIKGADFPDVECFSNAGQNDQKQCAD